MSYMTTLNASVVCLIKIHFFPYWNKCRVIGLRSQEFLVGSGGRWLDASFQQPILEKKLACYHTVLHFFHKHILNFYTSSFQFSLLSSFCLCILMSRRSQISIYSICFCAFIYEAISRYMVMHLIWNLLKEKRSSDQHYPLVGNGRGMLEALL